MKTLYITLFIFLISIATQAQSLEEIADSFTKNTPIQAPSKTLSLEEAQEISNAARKLIRKSLGKPVGYKAALTSNASQQRFQAKAPILGVLHNKMLFKSGTHFTLNQGVRLLYEGDILVKIGDKAINQASNEEEVMQFIESVIPFVEVPDLYFAADVKLNATYLQTVNAGAASE